MRSFATLSTFLLAAPLVFAQQITTVTVNPTPLKACAMATFNIQGTAPPGMDITFVNTAVSETGITLGLVASGPSSGSTSFNRPVSGGPFAEGEYTLTVSLEYNGTVTSVWNGELTVLPPDIPDVGEYNEITVCPNAAPFSLLSQLGGSPDAGGDWLDPQIVPVANGMFVPGVSPAGGYQYFFDMLPPCDVVSQFLVVSYHPNTTAGTDATVTLCTEAGTPEVDLFQFIGGTPAAGGTWSGLNTTGVFVPGVSSPGDYVYEVPGIAPCPNPTATITVEGGAPPNAGTGGDAIFCFDNAAADLTAHLTGEEDSGIWHAPDGSPVALHGDPVNVAAYGEGVYTYVVDMGPCPGDTAFVTVTLDGPPCTLGITAQERPGTRMMLMPNPASTQVVLEVERLQPGKGQYIVITDVSGKEVMRETLTPTGTFVREVLDISVLAPGAYLIDLEGCGPTTAQRLMVQ